MWGVLLVAACTHHHTQAVSRAPAATATDVPLAASEAVLSKAGIAMVMRNSSGACQRCVYSMLACVGLMGGASTRGCQPAARRTSGLHTHGSCSQRGIPQPSTWRACFSWATLCTWCTAGQCVHVCVHCVGLCVRPSDVRTAACASVRVRAFDGAPTAHARTPWALRGVCGRCMSVGTRG